MHDVDAERPENLRYRPNSSDDMEKVSMHKELIPVLHLFKSARFPVADEKECPIHRAAVNQMLRYRTVRMIVTTNPAVVSLETGHAKQNFHFSQLWQPAIPSTEPKVR